MFSNTIGFKKLKNLTNSEAALILMKSQQQKKKFHDISTCTAMFSSKLSFVEGPTKEGSPFLAPGPMTKTPVSFRLETGSGIPQSAKLAIGRQDECGGGRF